MSMNDTPTLTSIHGMFTEQWDNLKSIERKKIFLLGLVVVATTNNDETMLKNWLPHCHGVLSVEAIEEAILQTLLFAGFPKTIEALKHLRSFYPESSASKHMESRSDAGEKTSKLVYGRHHARLLQVMDELHPDLTRWMIEDGYGRILSRPGLSLIEREIAVLASLMASGMINQFRAHLRGACYVGIDKVDIIWFTNTFKCILAADLKSDFEKVIEQVLAEYCE